MVIFSSFLYVYQRVHWWVWLWIMCDTRRNGPLGLFFGRWIVVPRVKTVAVSQVIWYPILKSTIFLKYDGIYSHHFEDALIFVLQNGSRELQGQYAHNNQPAHHLPYLLLGARSPSSSSIMIFRISAVLVWKTIFGLLKKPRIFLAQRSR